MVDDIERECCLLELHEVCKVFVTEEIETHALSMIDLTVEGGDFVTIAGPSGCGKSTLLSILGLLDSMTTGEYIFGGRSVSRLGFAEMAEMRNKVMGFVFQGFNLIPDISVLENVGLPLAYRGVRRRDRNRRAEECLERVGLANRMKHMPGELSGGQQQRVAVARAVVGDPILLLADEPTGNLDSVSGQGVMDVLVELNREGCTICMVTHDPRYTDVSGRTVELFDGRIV